MSRQRNSIWDFCTADCSMHFVPRSLPVAGADNNVGGGVDLRFIIGKVGRSLY